MKAKMDERGADRTRDRVKRAPLIVWGLAATALAAALAPIPSTLVERFYSTGLYAGMQPAVTAASNQAPFALFDALLIVGAIGWPAAILRTIARAERRRWWRAAARAATTTLGLACGLYLAFLVLWGLNYRRVPLVAKLQIDRTRERPEDARALLARAVDALNDGYAVSRAPDGSAGEAWPGIGPAASVPPDLAAAFARVQQELGATALARPARPKTTVLDAYFRLAGVEGMIDPFLLETLVDSSLLPYERPFAIAHEWSHLAGYADEGEANFVGWLTCVQSGPRDRYSGWLFLYDELAGQLSPVDRAGAAARLAAGPRGDLIAIASRVRGQLSPRLSAVSWRVYDRYLKANRIEAGTESYDEVLQLVLGVRFAPGWVLEWR